MNILKFALAQIGSKSSRQSSKLMVLERDEIPGGNWWLKRNRSWRVGMFSRSDPVSRRAFEAGTFVSMRIFERVRSKQNLLLEIIPTASIGDAELMLSDMENRLERRPSDARKVLGTRVIRNHEVPGVANAWVYERETRGNKGSIVGRYIAGNVRHVVFLVETMGFVEPWPWTEVNAVAALQKGKVERTLAMFESGD
jgi:hypothetical protein